MRRDEKKPGLAERLYRFLLAAYPRHRRRKDGDDMGEMFSDIYRYEPGSRGIAGRTRLGAATLRDVALGSLKERRPVVDNLVQDLRHGVRRLRDNSMMTIAAVLTLALGIGAVTTIYSFVDALILNPLPYPEVDRLVVLGETTPRRGLNGEGWTHPAEFRQWQDIESLESIAALRPYFVTMTGAGDPERVIGYRASTNFFAVLGVEPFMGRGFASIGAGIDGHAEEDAVVLCYAFWQRRFDGDPEVLGKRFRLRDREAVVVGVMPRGAEFPMGTDLWVPLVLTPADWASYEAASLRPIGRLAPGASVAQLDAELAPLAAAAAVARPDTHAEVRIAVEPVLENITLNTRSALGFLMGAAACLLLLVCGNVANMQLAQGASRQREMAVRMALGAGRVRLARQLLTESLILATLAAIIGSLFAAWGSSVLRIGMLHERYRFYVTGVDDIGINTAVLAFTAVVSFGSVIGFGLIPALHCSRIDLNDALKRSAPASFRSGRLRRSLVVVEVALSVVLLVSAGLMATSIGAFARFEPGVDTKVLTVRLRLPGPGPRDANRLRAFSDDSIARLRALPGIRSVAIANRMPVTGDERGTAFEVESAQRRSAANRAERHLVGGDYFETLGISIVRGRGFDGRDRSGTPGVAIVSATLAERTWPGEPAVGRRLRFRAEDPWLTVVGVATDVARAWHDPRPAAAVYLAHTQSPSASILLLLRVTGGKELAAGGIRDEIWAVDDAVVVFAARSIEEALDEQAGAIRAMTEFIGWMATVALLVCLAGIYALVAHSAVQRTREIGVRLALGANQQGVVRMLVLHGLRTTGAGLAIGLLAAYAVARMLMGFLAGFMEGMAVDPVVFLVLSVGMLVMAALSSWLPARRASRVDPVVTLRAE